MNVPDPLPVVDGRLKAQLAMAPAGLAAGRVDESGVEDAVVLQWYTRF
jgi:hypothetical protein